MYSAESQNIKKCVFEHNNLERLRNQAETSRLEILINASDRVPVSHHI